MKLIKELKWKWIKFYCWINRENSYCPRHRTKLKKRYCKKCDLVYWRGSNIKIINKDYENGI